MAANKKSKKSSAKARRNRAVRGKGQSGSETARKVVAKKKSVGSKKTKVAQKRPKASKKLNKSLVRQKIEERFTAANEKIKKPLSWEPHRPTKSICQKNIN